MNLRTSSNQSSLMDDHPSSTPDTYLTLKAESQGLYKEKGSKFLAFAYPVNNEREIKEILESLKKQYHDARHHCYAYILGKDGQDFRANDDGEPGHSAGDPILGQIRSNNLTNTLIVVVRYFGGTKLGVGGLVTAYKTAAAEAIAANEIITAVITERVSFEFDYLDMNEVMRLTKTLDLKIIDQHFDNRCSMMVEVRQAAHAELIDELGAIPSVTLTD
jgi:uncharacterized YigZ family protein